MISTPIPSSTKPYLDAQIQARGYKIVPVGYTYVQPIGLYSLQIHLRERTAQWRP